MATAMPVSDPRRPMDKAKGMANAAITIASDAPEIVVDAGAGFVGFFARRARDRLGLGAAHWQRGGTAAHTGSGQRTRDRGLGRKPLPALEIASAPDKEAVVEHGGPRRYG